MVLSMVVRYLRMVQGPAGVGSCRNAAPAVRTGIACPPAPCSTAHLPATLPACLAGCSPRGDDLDTRLLRAMVVKGMLEQITTSQVGAAGRPDCWVPSAGCRVLGAAGWAVLGLPALTRAEGLELRAACLGHAPPSQLRGTACRPPTSHRFAALI
jgi:hypothetical protein